MTVSSELRARWRVANDLVIAIQTERDAFVAHTDERYHAALAELADVEEQTGADIVTCEGCAQPIFTGEPILWGDTPLCGECAPKYEDLLEKDAGFVNSEGDPLTPEECRAAYDAHIAAGGQPTDSMARAA